MIDRPACENGSGANVIAGLLLGDSRAMQRLRALVARLATSPASVLIEGPTGSGKELVAEALHVCSGRSGRFVPFNVCAIADGTFESALFGHVRGAFTGAIQDSPGYLTEADGGTAFFDEIGSLSLSAQAKMLRAIETRSFRPVGARHDRTSSFRLVAASNEDLAALIKDGRFRLDLYHRLRGLMIRVPALTEHIEDVPVLARHFARCAAIAEPLHLSDEAIVQLMNYPWPGNVRELRNVVEFAMALTDSPVIGVSEITDALGANGSGAPGGVHGSMRQHLVSLLAECGGDTARVADRLCLHRSNVYRLMRRLGISTQKRRRFQGEPSVSAAPPMAPCPSEYGVFAIDAPNPRPKRASAKWPREFTG